MAAVLGSGYKIADSKDLSWAGWYASDPAPAPYYQASLAEARPDGRAFGLQGTPGRGGKDRRSLAPDFWPITFSWAALSFIVGA